MEGWRPLKNKMPTTSVFDDMNKSARASASCGSENCLTAYAGTPESAVGLPMQVDESNHTKIDSQNEMTLSLLRQFYPEGDTVTNHPLCVQQFWENNCNVITSKCGRKVSGSNFETRLREWCNDEDNNINKLSFLRCMAELEEKVFRL